MTREGKRAKTPPPLPGECLPIPRVRAGVRDGRGEVRWLLETHAVEGLDLDGHGSPVVLVPPEGEELNQHGVWWRLFIQRGECGHELGLVVGMQDPLPALGESHGLRNFSVTEPLDDAGEGQGVGATVYVFDGERYVGGRTEYR